MGNSIIDEGEGANFFDNRVESLLNVIIFPEMIDE